MKIRDQQKWFMHETASCDDDEPDIGEGTKIWRHTHVMAGAHIGRNCNIGQNCYIDRGVRIGDGCKLQNNVSVYAGVTLEDYVFCGPSCVFTNVINPRSEIDRKDEFLATVVRRGATLGANSTIVCGTEIGHYAMVGAGAVVRQLRVPEYGLIVGDSEQIGWATRHGDIVKLEKLVRRHGIRIVGDWSYEKAMSEFRDYVALNNVSYVCRVSGTTYRFDVAGNVAIMIGSDEAES